MKNKIVRIKDIAEKAEVSKGTVDRVLHNRGRVSEEARERVLKIIQEMNYEPNLIARTLKSNKVYHIAAIIPDPLIDPYWEAPKSGLEKAEKELRHYGISVTPFIFNPYNVDSFLKKAKEATQSEPDGILLAPVFYREVLSFFDQWNVKRIPFVLFNTQIPDAAPLSYIGQDSYQSGYLVAKLLTFGLPEPCTFLVAHINEDIPNSAHLIKKEEGFRNYFVDKKLEDKYKVVRLELGNPDSGLFTEQLNKVRQQHPDLKAIFVTNSKAYEIAFYLEKHRIDNIKLIGYDLLPKNLYYLENSIINFLINQNPKGQGYWGIQQLTDFLVFKKEIQPIKYLPLDIITQENLSYYVDNEA
ncbi:LacI family DNA-binding transcriptional regulator [Adhaeribacter rhizoryzae]|uniref:Substrate-binding domain-containing protein n=1 Tax=Adhaeribacter rhizoryzae TaxID=2607907 RepID=A0A5M6DC90_9BACT|nr:LacI family DNA-binding transcriptional regulator [Adhaeribacter rhizoryzae]KAA5544983.1 substrate-binding domain-containing protein [Adhaeribacter rhizoryzae]